MKKKLEAPILVLGVIAAFSFGSHVGARDTIISDVTEDQTLTDTPVCGTIPANPEQTITHKKEWRLECKYQCPNNPQRDCNPASQMHLVQATGKCGAVACLPVIGGSTLEITGQEPNQEHTQKVPYQNKFIQAGGACVIGSEGESRKNFNTVYEEQACGAEACPGQEEEIEQCNAGDSAWWDYYTCECITSPIVIDLDGDGLSFTAVAAGVKFDLDRDGMREQLSWTRHADRDGFLALDRNRNGQIDDGGELFGSTTDQPPVRKKNGFLALAVFDRSDRGGNEDGVITQADRVFSDLRVWFDLNHDGVGQLSEQYPLDPVGITELSLSYSTVFERDRVGNVLRFVGDVKVAHRSDDPFKGRTRKAIDLFLQHGR